MTSLHVDVAVREPTFSLDAAFDVPSGSTAAIVGPNGAGKTTLLMTVAGFLGVHSGSVVAGSDVWNDAAAGVHVPPGDRNCGFVFQDLRLFPSLDVVDNVAFGLRARGVARADARRRALDALRECDLGEYATRNVRELSGGERQRVALARALVVRPRVLVLDEALSSLDAVRRSEMRALLRRVTIPAQTPRLIVTHDPAEAFAIGDLLVVIENGAVTWTGPPRAVRDAPVTSFLASLAGMNMVRGRLQRDAGHTWIDSDDVELVVPDNDLPSGIDAVATFPASAVTLATESPTVSARNVFRGVVSDVVVREGVARVRLDAAVPVTAAVTAQAVDELGVRPGVEVWAYVKATEVRLDVP